MRKSHYYTSVSNTVHPDSQFMTGEVMPGSLDVTFLKLVFQFLMRLHEIEVRQRAVAAKKKYIERSYMLNLLFLLLQYYKVT